MRPEDHAAARVMGRTSRALTSAAGAFLAVRLGAAAADLATRLGVGRAGPARVHLRRDSLVHDRLVDVGREERLGQVDVADGLALLVVERRAGHHLAFFSALVTLRITMSALRAPGSGPFTSSTLRSASALTMVAFLTVTVSLPIRPAMPVPLNTLPGYVPAPMEPGWRCESEPCVSGPRRKLWRLTVPEKPRPL